MKAKAPEETKEAVDDGETTEEEEEKPKMKAKAKKGK